MSSKSSVATLASRVQLMTWDTRHVRSIGMATSSSQDSQFSTWISRSAGNNSLCSGILMLVVRLSCGCHRRAHLHFLLLTKVLRGSWSVMTRSFNIALNFGNGVKVREFKLRSRTQEQAVFGRHLYGCVFARRRVFARLRCSNVCSELLATSGPRLSQLPTS